MLILFFIFSKKQFQLIQEIEDITDQDERIRSELSRKEKTLNLVKNNKVALEKSLNNLEDYLNKSSSRGFSQGYNSMNRSKI